jgi:hypothetical protein
MFDLKAFTNYRQPMQNKLYFTIILLLLSGNVAHAQIFGKRGPKGATPPKALLVTLLTRPTQREHLRKNRPELLPEFDRDVAEVAKRTRLDYSRYFRYCPVYFFVDSSANKIATGDWEGVLLDSALQPVTNPVIRPGDKNFFIAHYGNPIPQPDSVRPASPHDMGGAVEMDGDDPTALFREKLLVADADFKLLHKNGPRTNFVRTFRPRDMNSEEYRRYRKAITYNAKRWYIDYMPTAHSYDATLRKYFRE